MYDVNFYGIQRRNDNPARGLIVHILFDKYAHKFERASESTRYVEITHDPLFYHSLPPLFERNDRLVHPYFTPTVMGGRSETVEGLFEFVSRHSLVTQAACLLKTRWRL